MPISPRFIRKNKYKMIAFPTYLMKEASMVRPGDRVKMIVELIQPIAIENGMRFAIREGGRTVGAGVVSTILK